MALNEIEVVKWEQIQKELNKINLIAFKFKKRNFSWHAANTAIAC